MAVCRRHSWPSAAGTDARPFFSVCPTLGEGVQAHFWVDGSAMTPPPPVGVGHFWVGGFWDPAPRAPKFFFLLPTEWWSRPFALVGHLG